MAGVALYASYKVGGIIGNGIGDLILQARQRNNSPEAAQAHDAYKQIAATTPPPGLDPCEKLAFEIRREKQVIEAMRKFDVDFNTPGRHTDAISQRESGVRRRLDEMKKRGCTCPVD